MESIKIEDLLEHLQLQERWMQLNIDSEKRMGVQNVEFNEGRRAAYGEMILWVKSLNCATLSGL